MGRPSGSCKGAKPCRAIWGAVEGPHTSQRLSSPDVMDVATPRTGTCSADTTQPGLGGCLHFIQTPVPVGSRYPCAEAAFYPHCTGASLLTMEMPEYTQECRSMHKRKGSYNLARRQRWPEKWGRECGKRNAFRAVKSGGPSCLLSQ